MQSRHWLASIAAAVAFAAPLTAAAQGELVVYCTVQEEWCRPMVAAFEKATGIKVLMTRKSSGEFYAQIKAEAANPRGDIWWGGTGDPHLQAAEEGLTEPYKSPRLADLQDWAVRQAEQSKYRTVGVGAGAGCGDRRKRRRHHVPARRGRAGDRRRAAEDRLAMRGHRLRDRQHEHHQGREEHGQRQEVVRLGVDSGSAEHRRTEQGLVSGAIEQERERTAAGAEVQRDQVHQLRLREVWLVGGAHAAADEMGQGNLDAAQVTRLA